MSGRAKKFLAITAVKRAAIRLLEPLQVSSDRHCVGQYTHCFEQKPGFNIHVPGFDYVKPHVTRIFDNLGLQPM